MSLLPDVTGRFWRVWHRNLLVWRVYVWASLVGDIVEPLLYLFGLGLGLGMLMSDVQGVPYIAFIAPGIIASSAMYTAAFECTFGAYTRMARQGTYDAIRATPVSLDEIVAGEVMWGATKSVISTLAMMAVMLPFGLLTTGWVALLLPVSALTGVLFSSLAMLVTASTRGYESFSYFFTLALSPMFLFSGIFFPLDALPEWARTVSWFLPLTHGVDANRALFSGDPAGAALPVLWLGVAGAVVFLLAARAVRRRIIL